MSAKNGNIKNNYEKTFPSSLLFLQRCRTGEKGRKRIARRDSATIGLSGGVTGQSSAVGGMSPFRNSPEDLGRAILVSALGVVTEVP